MNPSYDSSIKYLSTSLSITLHIILLLLFLVYKAHEHFRGAAAPVGAPISAPMLFESLEEEAPREAIAEAIESIQEIQEKIVDETPSAIPEPQQEVIPPSPQQPTQKSPVSAPRQRRGKSAWTKSASATTTSATTQTERQPLTGSFLQKAFADYQTQQQQEITPSADQMPDHTLYFILEAFNRKITRALRETATFYERTIYSPTTIHFKTVVSVTLTKEGTTKDVVLKDSSPHKELDAALLEFCWQVRFPAVPERLMEGKELLTIPITVRIEQLKGANRLRFTVDSTW